MSPSPVRKDGKRRRQELLDAALACFAERGLLRTGIEDVRKRAGASPSSVYHQFKDLEALTLALLVRTFERLFAGMVGAVQTTSSAEDAVRAIVRSHLAWVFDCPDEAAFMYQAMLVEHGPVPRAELAAEKARMMAPLAAHLAPFAAAGTLPRLDPVRLELVVLGTCHETCRRYLGGADIDADWMREALPDVAWAAVERLLDAD